MDGVHKKVLLTLQIGYQNYSHVTLLSGMMQNDFIGHYRVNDMLKSWHTAPL